MNSMIQILRKQSGIVEDNIILIPSIYLLKTPHPKKPVFGLVIGPIMYLYNWIIGFVKELKKIFENDVKKKTK